MDIDKARLDDDIQVGIFTQVSEDVEHLPVQVPGRVNQELAALVLNAVDLAIPYVVSSRALHDEFDETLRIEILFFLEAVICEFNRSIRVIRRALETDLRRSEVSDLHQEIGNIVDLELGRFAGLIRARDNERVFLEGKSKLLGRQDKLQGAHRGQLVDRLRDLESLVIGIYRRIDEDINSNYCAEVINHIAKRGILEADVNLGCLQGRLDLLDRLRILYMTNLHALLAKTNPLPVLILGEDKDLLVGRSSLDEIPVENLPGLDAILDDLQLTLLEQTFVGASQPEGSDLVLRFLLENGLTDLDDLAILTLANRLESLAQQILYLLLTAETFLVKLVAGDRGSLVHLGILPGTLYIALALANGIQQAADLLAKIFTGVFGIKGDIIRGKGSVPEGIFNLSIREGLAGLVKTQVDLSKVLVLTNLLPREEIVGQ